MKEKSDVKVWDPLLRIFHWAIAGCILVSFLSIEFDKMEIHVMSGQIACGLLVFRILWGLFGTYTARFINFIKMPGKILRYLKGGAPATIGHSPIAALSVIAMLGLMSFQVSSGLFADDEIYTTGPLQKFVSSDFSSMATKYHAISSDILFWIVMLHLAAIIFYQFVRKKNLTKPMITGKAHMDMTELDENPDFVASSKNKVMPIIFGAISIAAGIGVYYWLETV